MTDSRSTDDDELDLFEARKAVASAKVSAIKTDAMLSEARQTNLGIRRVVQPNGFVEAFRGVIRGVA